MDEQLIDDLRKLKEKLRIETDEHSLAGNNTAAVIACSHAQMIDRLLARYDARQYAGG